MRPLEGKTAFVTGGSRGIGAAIATRLAADGANVALTYAAAAEQAATVAAAVEQHGVKALAVQADSADAEALDVAVRQGAQALGGLDILVHNAGVFPTGPIGELDLATIDRTLAIHVRALFVATKAALDFLPDGGRIITIGSNLADYAGGAGLSLYSASKAAVGGFTRGVARDLGPRGIAVTAVQPGATDTDMNPAHGEHAEAQRKGRAIDSYATPADLAATVAFLAGEGGRYITGTTITVDGGTNA